MKLTYIVTILLLTTCSAHPVESNPSQDIDVLLRRFYHDNQLLDSANTTLQMLTDLTTSFTLGSDEISLGSGDIEPVDILAIGASIEVDGVAMTPVSVVYKSKMKNCVRITKDITTGKFLSASAQHPTGKSDSIVQLGNTTTYATFSSDDFDNDALEAFALEEAFPPPNNRRSLRRSVQTSPSSSRSVIRELQSTCSSYDVITVSVVVDSLLCEAKGGAGAAEAFVQSVVADASMYYEAVGICAKLKLLNTYIFCNTSNDPIHPILDGAGNGNICNNRNSVLDGFTDYVREKSIPGDIVHLFHGKDFTGTSTVGCAWTGTLCHSGGYNSGVNEMTFSTSPTRLALLLAHESGHILDAMHVPDQDDIMYESLTGGTIFGPKSISSIRDTLDSSTCTDTIQPRPPAPAPISAPAPVPLPAPIPVPTPVSVPTSTKSNRQILFQSDFRSSTDGFVYRDDTFRGTNAPEYAQGTYYYYPSIASQALVVLLGGMDSRDVADMSGGWSRTFYLDNPSAVTITLVFDLEQASTYEQYEFSEVLCTVDGTLVGAGNNNNNFIARVAGGGATLAQETVTLQTDYLGAGNHELIVGGYSNKKTKFVEQTRVRIFSVEMSSTANSNNNNNNNDSPPPKVSCQDNDWFHFYADNVIVGCEWILEQSMHAHVGCTYSFITTNCPAACNQCP